MGRVHTDEVYFRDTVHGFLAWAVAAVIMAAALSSIASSIIGSAARGAGSLATAAVQAAGTAAAHSGDIDPMGYVVDTLFRSDRPDSNATPQDLRAETTRIIASGLRNGDVPLRIRPTLPNSSRADRDQPGRCRKAR
jgi:hypothetical protein